MTILSDILLLQAGGNAGLINLVFIAAMFLIFWLFLIRPQAKKQREQKAFMDGLKKGDDVVTASGILGHVNKIEDEIVTIDVGNKTFIRVTKNAISKELTEQVYAAKPSQTKESE